MFVGVNTALTSCVGKERKDMALQQLNHPEDPQHFSEACGDKQHA